MSALAPASAAGRRDLLAGFVLAAAGAFVIWEAGHYARGTLARMGPGFYPTLLGAALVLVGALLALNRGAAAEEEAVPPLDWRGAGCIVAGVLLFLLLGEYAGFAPATFGCVLVSALGDRTASLRGAALLAVGATVFGVLVFSWALGIQLPVWRFGGAA